MSRILSPRVIGTIVVVLGIIIFSKMVFPVALPTIMLKPEVIPGWNLFGILPITNTLLTTLIVDIVVIAIGLAAARSPKLVPSGLQNWMEALFEGFYNFGQDLVGPNMRRFFPLTMTIFLLVLTANWMERLPGFDAIGLVEEPHDAGIQTWKIDHVGPINIVRPIEGHISEAHPPGDKAAKPADGAHKVPEEGVLLPFLRGVATDLNFTLALALIAFVYIQYNGIKALGFGGYMHKFFNFSSPLTGFVGILEFISEFAKIISFSFRLFGNIFAGAVLLFVMQFLVPWILPSVFGLLEVLVGLIQAAVFAVLTLVFLAQAMEGHGEGHVEHGAAEIVEHDLEGRRAPGHGAAHA